MNSTKQSILIEGEADRQLSSLGYVVFPLLSEQQTQKLLEFYLSHHTHEQPGMSASAHNPDISFRKKMSDAIHETVVPTLEGHAVGIQALGGSFISKSAGSSGSLAPHQDWNITDERQYRSFNLWLPLVDTHKENGAIWVLPKSHLAGLNFRGPGIPSLCENIMEELWNAMTVLDIPAGHALLYDHRLIHASGANNSAEPRVVAVLGVLESDAPMHIYYGRENAVEVYACHADFFLEKNPNDGPADLNKLEQIAFKLQAPDTDAAIQILRNAGVPIQTLTRAAQEKSTTFSSFTKWLSGIFK
jgi:hypothetical protein